MALSKRVPRPGVFILFASLNGIALSWISSLPFKKKGRRRLVSEPVIDDSENTGDGDSRPMSSPYAGGYVQLYFGPSKTALQIPAVLLQKKNEKLSSRLGWNNRFDLSDISVGVGHVLVHHLYTGAYQCLKPCGSPHEKTVTEFATSIGVYTAARAYELVSLAEQAKEEIERHGASLSLSMVLRTLKGAYPNPSTDDLWFIEYVKSRVKAQLSDIQEVDLGSGRDNSISIAEI